MDRTQLEDALVQAHRKGDTEAARLFADEIKRLPAAEPGGNASQRMQASWPARVVQGMRDPIDAGAQLLARAVPESVTRVLDAPGRMMRESDSPLLQTVGERFFADPRAGAVDARMVRDERDYQGARRATAGGDPGVDVARFGGNVLSPANAAVASRLPAATTNMGRAAVGAVGGAAGGALAPVNDPDSQANFGATKAAQTGLGLLTGTFVAPIIGKIGDAIGRRIFSPAASEMNAGQHTDRVIREAMEEVGAKMDDVPKSVLNDMRRQVFQALRSGQQVDVAALARKADFDAVGVKPTLGQITRDPTQFAAERNLRGVAGVGDPLLRRFSEQNRQLGERIGGFGGKDAQPAYGAGSKFLEALNTIDEGLRKDVSAKYAAARSAAGRDLEVPLQGFAQDFAKVMRDFGPDNVPAAIKVRAAELGIMGGKQKASFTVDAAEDLLQTINKNWDPTRRAQASALDELRKAVKAAVLAADDQGGVYAEARKAAAQRFQLHDAVPALKAAVEGRIGPDDFVRKFLINGKTDDVRELADLFRQESLASVGEMRQQVGLQLLRAAFGENAAGDQILRPAQYAKVLREIGDDKLRAMFNLEEIAQMKALGRVGAYINATPSASPVNYSNTAAPLLSWFSRVPGVPAALSTLSAAQQAITRGRTVSGAMAAQVPQRAADLSPEARRTVDGLLGPLSVGFGVSAAEGVR